MDHTEDFNDFAERRLVVAIDQLDEARAQAETLRQDLQNQTLRWERARMDALRLRDERDRHRQAEQFLAERVSFLEALIAANPLTSPEPLQKLSN